MKSIPNSQGQSNCFDDFFIDPIYLQLKKLFWNYQIRRKAIQAELEKNKTGSVLEVGAGIAPMVSETNEVVYTDISSAAIRFLLNQFPTRKSVVASAEQLPFPDGQFDLVVSSEVLEHILKDGAALQDIFRVLKPGGKLIVTVPVHAYFFGWDDQFVHHERRYNPAYLKLQLEGVGFEEIRILKIAGLLDKMGLMSAVLLFKLFSAKSENYEIKNAKPVPVFSKVLLSIYGLINAAFGFLVQVEARIVPLCLATIVMIDAQKKVGSNGVKFKE